jgi:transcriptional regulator with XRE-family HTH domain
VPGVNRSELGRRVGVSSMTITRWEDPEATDKPALDVIDDLAAALGVTAPWLPEVCT